MICIKKIALSPCWISRYTVPNHLIIPIVLFLLAFSSNKFDSAEPNVEHELLEKIYIQFNNNFYLAGDDIWFKVYLVDAKTHKLEAPSKVAYVDLIDPTNKIVESKIVKIEEGYGEGDFKLPLDMIRGQYIVRAYTNFMRNFDDTFIFRKKLYINSMLSKGKANNVQLHENKTKKTQKQLT